MNVSKELKDGLKLIFLDAKGKSYIGPILKKINPEQQILPKEAIFKTKSIKNCSKFMLK